DDEPGPHSSTALAGRSPPTCMSASGWTMPILGGRYCPQTGTESSVRPDAAHLVVSCGAADPADRGTWTPQSLQRTQGDSHPPSCSTWAFDVDTQVQLGCGPSDAQQLRLRGRELLVG